MIIILFQQPVDLLLAHITMTICLCTSFGNMKYCQIIYIYLQGNWRNISAEVLSNCFLNLKFMKGSTIWSSPATRRGSTLALRNISNIPLEKNASGTPCGQQTRQSSKKPLVIYNNILFSSLGRDCLNLVFINNLRTKVFICIIIKLMNNL